MPPLSQMVSPREAQILLTSPTYKAYVERCTYAGIEPRTGAAYRTRRYTLRKQAIQSEPGAVDHPVPVPAMDDQEIDDDGWEELFLHLESAEELREDLTTSTKAIDFTFPMAGPMGIAIVSDVHAGAGGVQYALFKEDMGLLATTDGLYGLFNGDAFENTKPQLKSATALYSAAFANPSEQYEWVRRRFGIARGKWLGIGQGNHDAFDYRVAGVDRLRLIASELEAPYYTEAGATLKITVGTQTYTIFAKHDYVGKSKINKSNSQRRLFDEWAWADGVDADVIALSHLHEPDKHDTIRKGRPVVYLRSGTYKTRDSWSESMGYRPSYGVPIIILDPDQRNITSFPGHQFREGVEYLSYLRST
jgi:hypothetical protein